MKDTPASVPEITEHLNPVTEQFGPVLQDLGQRPILHTAQNDSGFLHQSLSPTEQIICDTATD